MSINWYIILTFYTIIGENCLTNSQSGFVLKIMLSLTQYIGELKEILKRLPISIFNTELDTARVIF